MTKQIETPNSITCCGFVMLQTVFYDEISDAVWRNIIACRYIHSVVLYKYFHCSQSRLHFQSIVLHAVWSAIGMVMSVYSLSVRPYVCDTVHCG